MSHLPQLLEKIFLLTRMDSIFSAMPDGKERVANLQAFCQLVSDYDANGPRDLGQFLEHLEAIQERGLSITGELQQAGCVTIMSIHKSKGLEFPVVFLCGLSRSFNQESARDQVLCDRELGLGLSCVDATQRIRYPSIAKRAIAAKILSDSISEEMRVLYVAMTRARDRLIMTYAARNLEAELQDIAMRMDLSDKILMTSQVDCPGAWVLQTAMKRTEAGAFFALSGYPDVACCQEPAWLIQVVEAPEAACTGTESLLQLDCLEAEMIARLKEDLSFVYTHSDAMQTPSKQTATQLKGRIKDQEAAEGTVQAQKTSRRFRKPSFIQANPQGVEYGSIMHAVMQYIRYEACENVDGVRNEVMGLVQRGLISDEQAIMVPCDQIAAFFATDIGRLLRSSRDVLREFKFSILDDGSCYVPGMEGEQVLLQGVVDCALMEPDGITVIDFKTDYVTEETLPQVAERYRIQVTAYADALKRIYRRPIKSALLYFFRMNRFFSVQ